MNFSNDHPMVLTTQYMPRSRHDSKSTSNIACTYPKKLVISEIELGSSVLFVSEILLQSIFAVN